LRAALGLDAGDQMRVVSEPSSIARDFSCKGIAIGLACGVAAMVLPVTVGLAQVNRDRTALSVEQRSNATGNSQSRNEGAPAQANNVALPLPSAKRETAPPTFPPMERKGHWWSSLGSLALVLALIVLAARLFQSRSSSGNLPRGVVEVVGRCPLDAKQSLYVVRWGGRLLLIGGGPNGARTLSELSDAEEIERVAAICDSRAKRSLSATLLSATSETLRASRQATSHVAGQEAT